MSNRGYFGIGCTNMKAIVNYGTLFRSAICFGADFIFLIGKRFKKQASDTMCSWRHIPLYEYQTCEEFLDLVEHDEKAARVIAVCFDTDLPEDIPERISSWEMLYFNHTTVMGCIEVLTSIQRNLRLAENEVIRYLMNS